GYALQSKQAIETQTQQSRKTDQRVEAAGFRQTRRRGRRRRLVSRGLRDLNGVLRRRRYGRLLHLSFFLYPHFFLGLVQRGLRLGRLRYNRFGLRLRSGHHSSGGRRSRQLDVVFRMPEFLAKVVTRIEPGAQGLGSSRRRFPEGEPRAARRL